MYTIQCSVGKDLSRSSPPLKNTSLKSEILLLLATSLRSFCCWPQRKRREIVSRHALLADQQGMQSPYQRREHVSSPRRIDAPPASEWDTVQAAVTPPSLRCTCDFSTSSPPKPLSCSGYCGVHVGGSPDVSSPSSAPNTKSCADLPFPFTASAPLPWIHPAPLERLSTVDSLISGAAFDFASQQRRDCTRIRSAVLNEDLPRRPYWCQYPSSYPSPPQKGRFTETEYGSLYLQVLLCLLKDQREGLPHPEFGVGSPSCRDASESGGDEVHPLPLPDGTFVRARGGVLLPLPLSPPPPTDPSSLSEWVDGVVGEARCAILFPLPTAGSPSPIPSPPSPPSPPSRSFPLCYDSPSIYPDDVAFLEEWASEQESDECPSHPGEVAKKVASPSPPLSASDPYELDAFSLLSSLPSSPSSPSSTLSAHSTPSSPFSYLPLPHLVIQPPLHLSSSLQLRADTFLASKPFSDVSTTDAFLLLLDAEKRALGHYQSLSDNARSFLFASPPSRWEDSLRSLLRCNRYVWEEEFHLFHRTPSLLQMADEATRRTGE